MESRDFDAFTQRLAKGRPRRQTLALLATAVSLPLGLLARPAAAGCKKVGKKCDKNKDCCDHAKCQGKTCKCKSGFDECGGKCYRLDSDENHCGACDVQCDQYHACLDGACVPIA